MGKPYTIPENVLQMLTEHSAGGYYLFALSSENGIQVYSKTDNKKTDIYLQDFISKWVDAGKMADVEAICMQMMGVEVSHSDSDSEYDDFDEDDDGEDFGSSEE